MGLGKTVQVVCFLESILRQRLSTGPALVVAPKSILLQWEKVHKESFLFYLLSLHYYLYNCSLSLSMYCKYLNNKETYKSGYLHLLQAGIWMLGWEHECRGVSRR